MRIHLYTNFSLGAGFQFAELTPQGLARSEMSSAIRANFTNGGCSMALKSVPSENMAYLMIKDIIYVNKRKRIDDQGRKVFINFALETESSEISVLRKILMGFLSEYSNASTYLGTLFYIPANNAYNYGVDYNRFIALFHYLKSLGELLANKKITDSECSLDEKLCHFIENAGLDRTLIVLKGNDPDYYARLDAELSRTSILQSGKYGFLTEMDVKPLLEKVSSLDAFSSFSCEVGALCQCFKAEEKENAEAESELDLCEDAKLKNDRETDSTALDVLESQKTESTMSKLDKSYLRIPFVRKWLECPVIMKFVRFMSTKVGCLILGAAMAFLITYFFHLIKK